MKIKVYAMVILYDNKIVGWKATISPIYVDNLDVKYYPDIPYSEMKVLSNTFIGQASDVWDRQVTDWYRQWEVHELYKGFVPHASQLEGNKLNNLKMDDGIS